MTQMGYVWGVGRVRSSKYLVGAKKERVNHRLGGDVMRKGSIDINDNTDTDKNEAVRI